MATLQELEDALIIAGESGNTKATESISNAMREHPTFRVYVERGGYIGDG